MLCERCRTELFSPQRHRAATWTDLLAIAQVLKTTGVDLAKPWSRQGPRGDYGLIYRKRAMACAALRVAGFTWASIADVLNRHHASAIAMACRAHKRWPNEVKQAHEGYVIARRAFREPNPVRRVAG